MNIVPKEIIRAEQLIVYLDGVEVDNVVRANSEVGEIEVYAFDDDGKHVFTEDRQDVVTTTLNGVVRFGIKALP